LLYQLDIASIQPQIAQVKTRVDLLIKAVQEQNELCALLADNQITRTSSCSDIGDNGDIGLKEKHLRVITETLRSLLSQLGRQLCTINF
jgi:hypothetical protein